LNSGSSLGGTDPTGCTAVPATSVCKHMRFSRNRDVLWCMCDIQQYLPACTDGHTAQWLLLTEITRRANPAEQQSVYVAWSVRYPFRSICICWFPSKLQV
jgi:hypothetical protein